MTRPNVNVTVGGPKKPTNYTYKTVVLKNNLPFDAQVTEPNCIYIIKWDFDLGGEEVTIPENCVLKFEGGSLSNGTIVNIGKIANPSNGVIFKNITFTSPQKQTVLLKWFDNSSIADSIMTASLFGSIDAEGTWQLDKYVDITNDIELFNGTFNCISGVIGSQEIPENYTINIKSPDISKEVLYSGTINVIDPTGDNNYYYEQSIAVGNSKQYKYCLLKGSNWWFTNDPNYIDTNIYSIHATPRHGKAGEMVKVKSMTDNKTIFDDTLVCKYTVDDVIYPFNVSYFNPIKVNVRNCRFIGTTPETDKGGALLYINYAIALVDNCDFEGGSVGLYFWGCDESVCSNSRFSKYDPWGVVFGGATINSKVLGCNMTGGRHGFAVLSEESIVKYALIANNTAISCQSAFNTHCNAYGVVFDGNYISNCPSGISSMSPHTIIRNNTIENYNGYNKGQACIYCGEAGFINPIIENNTISGYGYGMTPIRCYDGLIYTLYEKGDPDVPVDTINAVYQTELNYIICRNNVVLNMRSSNLASLGNIDTPVPYIIVTGNMMDKCSYIPINIAGVGNSVEISGNSVMYIGAGHTSVSPTMFKIVGRKEGEDYVYVSADIVGNYVGGSYQDKIGEVTRVGYVFAKDNILGNKHSNLISLEDVDIANLDYGHSQFNYTTLDPENPDSQIDVYDLPDTRRYENAIVINGITKKIIHKVSGDDADHGGFTWREYDAAADGVKRSGLLSEKPSRTDIYIGFKYFCTDLHYPIYYGGYDQGEHWYKADGTEITDSTPVIEENIDNNG